VSSPQDIARVAAAIGALTGAVGSPAGAALPALPGEDLIPAFRLSSGGLPLLPDAAADVLAVAAHQDVDLPGMFTVRLLNRDPLLRRPSWSESTLLGPGAPLELALGYRGPAPGTAALSTVLAGEITGIEPEFGTGGPDTVLVRGYDRRHRLMRGASTVARTQVTDSALAQQIGAARGLLVQATPTTVVYEQVLQYNQTDLEFLQARAARIGFEVSVVDRTLHFRPRRRPGLPTASLRLDATLLSFRPRLTTMGQTSGVSVQGWNPTAPRTMLRVVSGEDDPTAAGAPSSRVQPTAGALQVGNRTVLGSPTDPVDAEQLAAAQAGRTTPWLITASGTCIGDTRVAAGELIGIEGVGSRFSGTYAVTSAVHTYEPAAGYRTAFDARKEPP
jgi:phage protein D